MIISTFCHTNYKLFQLDQDISLTEEEVETLKNIHEDEIVAAIADNLNDDIWEALNRAFSDAVRDLLEEYDS